MDASDSNNITRVPTEAIINKMAENTVRRSERKKKPTVLFGSEEVSFTKPDEKKPAAKKTQKRVSKKTTNRVKSAALKGKLKKIKFLYPLTCLHIFRYSRVDISGGCI